MSRYRGPRLRITRRLGDLPGLTQKVSRKINSPGQHGTSMNKKMSQYNLQLREKQKLRYNYGITEKQLLNYVKSSRKSKGSSGKILLTLLEMRLDNIIFKLGFAPTIISARQLINHKHIRVNNNCVNIASYQCKPNDIITIKSSKRSQNLIENNLEKRQNFFTPDYLTLNRESKEGKVMSLAHRNSVGLVINELLIVEYFSRKV